MSLSEISVKKHLIWLLGLLIMLVSGGVNRMLQNEFSGDRAAKKLEKWIDSKISETSNQFERNPLPPSAKSQDALFVHYKGIQWPEYTEVMIYSEDGALQYWSDNQVLISNPENFFKPGYRLLKLNNTFYVVAHTELPGGLKALSLVTIYHAYPTVNRFLVNGFTMNSSAVKGKLISTKEDEMVEGSAPVAINGQILFSVTPGSDTKQPAPVGLLIFEFFGLLLLITGVNRRVQEGFQANRPFIAAVFFVLIFLLTELAVGLFDWPAFTGISAIFSSSSYASPLLGDTLGILFLRVLLFHWIMQHGLRYYMQHPGLSEGFKQSVLSVAIAASFYALIFIIASLHHHSNISFELYNFDLINFNSFLGIVIICISVSLIFLPFRFIKYEYLGPRFYSYMLPVHAAGLLIGVLFGSFHSVAFTSLVLLWFVLYLLMIHFLVKRKDFYQQHRFFSNLVLTALFAMLAAGLLLHFSAERRLLLYQQKAVELASERDVLEEFKLSETVAEMREDNFIKNYFSAPYMSGMDIERRVQFRYLSGYLGKYNLYIHTFNADGVALRGESTRSFFELQNALKQPGVDEIEEGLFYLSVQSRGEKYLVFMPVEQDSVMIGYLSVALVPKVFTTFSAYPELLRAERSTLEDPGLQNSYAVYQNGQLINKSGSYPYFNYLPFKEPQPGSFEVVNSDGHRHIIYSTGDKQVVYSEQLQTATGILALFSYLILFLLLFFLFSDFIGLYKDFGGDYSLQSLFSPNTLQKQIQSAMVVIVLSSLVMVAAVTFYYFTVQYNSFHNERLLQRGNSVISSLSLYYTEEKALADSTAVLENVFARRLKQLRDVFELDINAFSVDGKLMQSTQPEIFKRGLVAPIMNPSAFEAMQLQGLTSFMQNERIGKLKFVSAYLPFRNESGEVVAFVNFPYFGKERSFRQDISYFFVVLVNIYVFMILGAAVLSLLLSRTITRPLKIVADAIGEVELGRKGRALDWKNNDEIGLLVKQYNRMISELEQSAAMLARSEREGAWREMARQVAHEIKNPLMPMKLRIQMLQKAIKEGREDIGEMTAKTAESLIEQIETLANIATAFSDFARMPVGSFAEMDLAEVLSGVVTLFRAEEGLSIETKLPGQSCRVWADKEQMIRVFNNVLKNAVQALEGRDDGRIKVSLTNENGQCLISISDNGPGIPAERAQAVFEPNFTTKSAGTGLGLAMCKSIVEAAGGRIWFENNPEAGTTFFIELNTLK